MNLLNIDYSHEFISNKITDELILYDIWNYKDIETLIIAEIEHEFLFKPGINRNINTLSGGQRSITYLVTLTFILKCKKYKNIELHLNNIIESLSIDNGKRILNYLKARGLYVN